jgi:hypothetical protein
LLDARRKERRDNSQGLEDFECAWFYYRGAIPLQRGRMYIDDTALDPTAMELRSQEKPGRACTHHKNTHISNHVDLLVEKTGVPLWHFLLLPLLRKNSTFFLEKHCGWRFLIRRQSLPGRQILPQEHFGLVHDLRGRDLAAVRMAEEILHDAGDA